jgi:hypothetical protein
LALSGLPCSFIYDDMANPEALISVADFFKAHLIATQVSKLMM